VSPSILDAVQALGLHLRGSGTKRTLACPLPGHDDTRASAVIFLEQGRFHCSVCTPGRSLSAAELLGATGFTARAASGFTSSDARSTWALAQARTRDESTSARAEDEEVYGYLASRGLGAAWEERAYGIVARSMGLPRAIVHWPAGGYRIVLPLYDVTTGELVNLQARSVRQGAQPKTLFPRGTRARGLVFANSSGLRMLSGERAESAVVLAEGLTDHLALSIHTALPVISAPGTTMAATAISSWVRDRKLIVALDGDRAGELAAGEAVRLAHLAGARSVARARWPGKAKDACEALEALGARGFRAIAETWEKL